MYAVVSSGGKQYRVEPGATLTMERVAAGAGEPFTFDRVLLIGDGDDVTVGTPVVSGASVSATILGEELGPKLVIFKFKQKVKYRRRTGHRQHLVRVRIDAINADGRSVKAEAPAKAEAPTAPEKPKPATRRSRPAKPEAAKATEAAGTEQPEAEKPKPRARRAPAKASAKKASASEASASEEKPKRAPRARTSAKKTQEQQ